MLLAGDESGNTQFGNNNAYCQDNEISWIDWNAQDKELMEFTAQLIQFRKSHPVFARKQWFKGRPVRARGLTDIGWFLPDGTEMTEEHWKTGYAKSLGVFLYGGGLNTVDQEGKAIVDDSFYILFNGHGGPLDFKLPVSKYGKSWKKVWDTAHPTNGNGKEYAPDGIYKAEDRSVVLLMSPLDQGKR
jgi:glycogen operon protein